MSNHLAYLRYIQPLSERFIRYYLDPQKPVKLKLSDVLTKDLQGEEYHQLLLDLAIRGYEIEFLKSTGKNSIGVGLFVVKPYSYFVLHKTDLRNKVESLASNEFREAENKIIESLANEVKYLKSSKKAGQKSFNDVEVIKKAYNNYLNGMSLSQIAEELNIAQIPTKRGGKWYKSTVRYMLTNQEYVFSGCISNEIFQHVQSKLKD